jgi:hypothetical protein
MHTDSMSFSEKQFLCEYNKYCNKLQANFNLRNHKSMEHAICESLLQETNIYTVSKILPVILNDK